jgi:hypothetical protein
MEPRYEPVFIGPSRAGKSTLAPLVAEALGLPVVKVDRLRWQYYERWGFTRAVSDRISAEEGFAAVLRVWKPFEIRLVEAVFADFRDCLFDFGAGFAMFDDEDHAMRLRAAMFQNVVLVLPSRDEKESIRVLWGRSPKYDPAVHKGGFFDFPRYEVRHPLPRAVATRVLYTEGRSPGECAQEVVRGLVPPSPAE